MSLAEVLNDLRQPGTPDNLPVLLEFWAPWCGPCRAMAPMLDQLTREYAGKVIVHKINADQQPDLLRELNIMAIPTMLVVIDGQVVQRRTGAQSPTALATLFAGLAAGGGSPGALPKPEMDPVTRMLWLVSGLIVGLLGLWLGYGWVILLGGLIAFWGWHDRCPIWQALWPRISAVIKKQKRPETSA